MEEKRFNANDIDVARELGEIKQTLKDYCEANNRQDIEIKELKTFKTTMDILFGKIGVVVIAVGFIIATAWTFLIDYIKDKFFD